MRLGEQGVLSVEQWLEQEAAADRDAMASAAAAKKYRESASADYSELPTSSATSVGGDGGGAGTGTQGFRVGVDPWLLSAGTARSLTSKLTKNGGCLVPTSGYGREREGPSVVVSSVQIFPHAL